MAPPQARAGMRRQTTNPASDSTAINPATAGSPAAAYAIAPAATPMLPPRNVHALITPAPAPARSGGRAASARRGAAVYGTARPIPTTNKPISSHVQFVPADPVAIAVAASAVRIMAALNARRG